MKGIKLSLILTLDFTAFQNFHIVMKLGITLIMFPYFHCRLRRLGGKDIIQPFYHNLKLTIRYLLKAVDMHCLNVSTKLLQDMHTLRMHIHSNFVWGSSSKMKDQYLVLAYKGKNLAKTSSRSLHRFTETVRS